MADLLLERQPVDGGARARSAGAGAGVAALRAASVVAAGRADDRRRRQARARRRGQRGDGGALLAPAATIRLSDATLPIMADAPITIRGCLDRL